ncbi:hypothetical protein J1614_012271 [Plenodomus biglobosus]|nr:hypothetical protein J1614_012271 [Plenodomus biglobosus]
MNSNEKRQDVDHMLKMEFGQFYVGTPGFRDAFFKDVPNLTQAARTVFTKFEEGASPLYHVEMGWKSWPEGAKENEVLGWMGVLID